MKQRLQLGCLCEVAALSPKKEIGGEYGNSDKALGKILKVSRSYPQPSIGKAGEPDEEQCRKYASCSSLIAGEKREATQHTLPMKDAMDQIPHDNEKGRASDR